MNIVMKRKFVLWIALTIILSVCILMGSSRLSADSTTADKIESGLLSRAGENGSVQYIVRMTAEADLSAAYEITDWAERGEYVVKALQATAATSQADVIAELKSNPHVTEIEPFFISNSIIVTSDSDMITRLSERADVAALEGTKPLEFTEADTPVSIEKVYDRLGWGIEKTNADDVWNTYGTTGENVVVGSIDSGVKVTHPALENQYRGNVTGSHDHNFYDPGNKCNGTPCDWRGSNEHGTGTMGVAVGGTVTTYQTFQLGMAPGAKFVAAASDLTNSGTLQSFQWMLAPCDFGDDPGDASCDASERPHIVYNTLNYFNNEAIMDAYEAAGIILVTSSGNNGSVGYPGSYCNIIAVGGTDADDLVPSWSSTGPGLLTECENKPDVSAPGSRILVALTGNNPTGLISGTSYAAPHVAGCLALMKSVDATLSFEKARDILTATAVDIDDLGFDVRAGYGRIDCLAAVDAVEETLSPEVGTVTTNQTSSTQWHDVTFDRTFYEAPIVVMSPVSFNGGHQSVVRVRNVTTTGFQYQIDEWDYLDGGHTTETLFYIAMSAGTREWERVGGGDLTVTAGKMSNIGKQWKSVSVSPKDDPAPVVLVQVASDNEDRASTVRTRYVGNENFQIRRQVQEADASTTIIGDEVHYIVFERGKAFVPTESYPFHSVVIGRTPDNMTSAWKTINFDSNYLSDGHFFANMQTFDGGDVAALRYRNLALDSVQIKIEEEKSANDEVIHTTEQVGWVVFGYEYD